MSDDGTGRVYISEKGPLSLTCCAPMSMIADHNRVTTCTCSFTGAACFGLCNGLTSGMFLEYSPHHPGFIVYR